MLVLHSKVSAQGFTTTDSTLSNPYAVADSLLSQLDKTGITTGLLLDRAMPAIKVADYNGQQNAEALFDENEWEDIYKAIYHAQIQAGAGVTNTDTWFDDQLGLLAQGTIPIRCLHYNYHQALPDSNDLYQSIYWDGSYLQDKPNKPHSAWEQKTVFAAAPAQSRITDTLAARFIIKPEFLFSNTGLSIQSISIDFGNGAGLQPITIGEDFTITWPDTGTYTLAWKTEYTNGTIWYGNSSIRLVTTKTSGTSAFWGYNGNRDDEFYITSGKSQNLGARMQIEYGCGNHGLTKPFVYVEGFNPEVFGNTTYSDLFNSLRIHQRDYSNVNNMHTDILVGLQQG